jgi:hypothetical protein
MGIISKLFKTKVEKKEDARKKIYVGNALMKATKSSMTLDITEIMQHKEYFKRVHSTIDSIPHYEVDLSILPFKKGINRFGNSHYIIIKNK